MSLSLQKVRASRLLGLKVYIIPKRSSLYREGYRYRISTFKLKTIFGLAKTITIIKRKRRKQSLMQKLDGHRLKRGYRTVKRTKRRKGKVIGNGRKYKEKILGLLEGPGLIADVQAEGCIRDSQAVREHGKYSDLPLAVRRKTGLPLDEMADVLYMSEDDLWDELAHGGR